MKYLLTIFIVFIAISVLAQEIHIYGSESQLGKHIEIKSAGKAVLTIDSDGKITVDGPSKALDMLRIISTVMLQCDKDGKIQIVPVKEES